MKYNQSPWIGSSVALMASELGLQIGPGGSPNFLYVLYGEFKVVDFRLRKMSPLACMMK
jgi:hypothetical protein